MLYHLDRSGTLKPGMNLTLDQVKSDKELGVEGVLLSVRKMFPEGVSKFGLRYLKTSCSCADKLELHTPHGVPSNTPSAIIEAIFELVRRADFPDIPSRFTSLFCVGNLTWFDNWSELTSKRAPVYEIKPHETCRSATLDASFLVGGIQADPAGDMLDISFSFPVNVSNAYRYWSGERSQTPKLETLVELPVTVGRALSSEESARIF